MIKSDFFKYFPNDNSYLISTVWEDISLCLDIEYPILGKQFFSPYIAKQLYQLSTKLNIKMLGYKLTEHSEKELFLFYPKTFDIDNFISKEEIIYFKIDCSNRFKTLQHKNFLGTIMNLGIKREMLGDILVKDNIAYCISSKDTYDIIKLSMNSVSNIPATILAMEKEDIPKSNFKEKIYNVSSLRMDSIVSSLINESRTKTVMLIEKGDILVNYVVVRNKNKILNINDVITIRKKGKFILSELVGTTKKLRLKIMIKQYI